jgi:hypothetical protein
MRRTKRLACSPALGFCPESEIGPLSVEEVGPHHGEPSIHAHVTPRKERERLAEYLK